jgi:hypothetical protein
VVAALLLLGGDGETPRGQPQVAFRQPIFEQLSARPLSAHAAERRLEARFTALRDDDTAAARCTGREPRPAYSVRYCRIRYPNGSQRTVTVLTNARGRELLVER